MINFKAGLHSIIFFVFSSSGLLSIEPEVKTVSKKEGETISLHSRLTGEQTNPLIMWSFDTGSSKKIIAELNRGDFTTIHSQRFRDRLQLDRQTWSLNISNLNSKDTGVYYIYIFTNGESTDRKLNLIVYSPVPKPVITHITPRYSVSRSVSSAVCRKSCSVLCSVKNEREVVLSWQREGETLFNTSSPDLNSTLSLPLETENCSAALKPSSAEPISNQTVPLNTEELCLLSPESSKTRNYILPAVMIPVVVIAVIACVGFFIKNQKSKELEHTGNRDVSRESGELQYADVCIGAHPKETQRSEGVLRALDPEREDGVVYADDATQPFATENYSHRMGCRRLQRCSHWIHFLFACHLLGFHLSLAQTPEQTTWVKGILGGFVTFPAPVLKTGTLSYKDLGAAAMVVKGSSDTELIKQFTGRLQCSCQTGLFTITHLRAEDSGTYVVDSKDEQSKLTFMFQLEVYKNVSSPTVTWIQSERNNCSVLCFVENGREVTLSWLRDGEMLSRTSNPDINTSLSLLLELEGEGHTYYCETRNPVSSQLSRLDVPSNCTEDSRFSPSVAQTPDQTMSVKGILGGSATFPAPVFKTGSLSYKDQGTAAVVLKGRSDTDFIKQFRGRLQWDSQIGLFTITHLRTEDSGTYVVDCKDESKLTFQLEVYKNVSTPTVTWIQSERKNCSVLCFVENGREVTLSWLRDGEMLSHTSSPDTNTSLSLLLALEKEGHTYYCETKNPVSSQLYRLDVPSNCTEDSDQKAAPRNYTIPLAVGMCSLLVLTCGMGMMYLCLQRRRRRFVQVEKNIKLTTVYDEVQPCTVSAAEQC
ncbi:uncharacterized protein LOC135256039 [Anguilla rostrata]|uniref:uncharacterized protein LOC135256039 n=1 Tax=Anguilla rostrata TaxID=7938 RepID=UPI0030D254DE